ncbi:MAG TPA: glycosyltransferase [Saccharofermentans sp.]|nr:glycosyltransferase [Saccharofermentans sp.]
MSEKNLISIYCPTYNSGVKRTLLSLESARLQEYTNKELIIGDDGSRDDTVQAIETFLSKYENNFKRVVLIKHDENIGIVRNLESIYDHCRGELMIGISPGDPLYSSETLFDIAKFYELKRTDLFVGLMRSYRMNGSFREVNFLKPHPRQEALLMNPKKTFRKLIYGNFISGISLVQTRKLLQTDEFCLPENIKLLEDWPFLLLYTLSGRSIPMLHKFIRWYEYGSGISTSQNPSSKQLREDSIFFLHYLRNKILSDGNLKHISRDARNVLNRRIAYTDLQEQITNRFKRRIVRLLRYPDFATRSLARKVTNSLEGINYKKLLRETESIQGSGFRDLLIEFLAEK